MLDGFFRKLFLSWDVPCLPGITSKNEIALTHAPKEPEEQSVRSKPPSDWSRVADQPRMIAFRFCATSKLGSSGPICQIPRYCVDLLGLQRCPAPTP